MGGPQKRSVTIDGHRTSVSIEAEFWLQLEQIAARRNNSLNELITEIDHERPLDTDLSEAPGTKQGLSSAIRVFILKQALDPNSK